MNEPWLYKGGGALHLHEFCGWRSGEAGFVTVSKELAALWVRVAKRETKPGHRGVGGVDLRGGLGGGGPSAGAEVGGGNGRRRGRRGSHRLQLGWGQQRLAEAVSAYWRRGPAPECREKSGDTRPTPRIDIGASARVLYTERARVFYFRGSATPAELGCGAEHEGQPGAARRVRESVAQQLGAGFALDEPGRTERRHILHLA